MAGIRTCDRESQVQRPNHYTTEPPKVRVLLTCCSCAHSPYILSRNMQTPCRRVDRGRSVHQFCVCVCKSLSKAEISKHLLCVFVFVCLCVHLSVCLFLYMYVYVSVSVLELQEASFQVLDLTQDTKVLCVLVISSDWHETLKLKTETLTSCDVDFGFTSRDGEVHILRRDVCSSQTSKQA